MSIYGLCIGLMSVFPQNSYTESLTPSVVVCGDGASTEVVKVKWSHKGGDLIQ